MAHLDELVAAGERPLLAAYSEGTLERLKQVLADHGFDALTRVERWADVAQVAVAAIAVLPLERGFTAPGVHILGEHDLLGDRLTAVAKRSRRAADKFIQDISALGEGDLVVHAEHGIGRFEGLVTLEIGGAPHDCLKLIYHGGDKLFVPVENLDVLSRYGHADQEVVLDRLGGVGWQTRKAKVKERIRELAGELIKVAAERLLRKGTALDLPHGVYEEFAARFPYEETEDQLSAIEAVLEDMGSRPADGPADLRRCRLRQDRGGAARRVRGRHGRQAGGAAGADDAAGAPAFPRCSRPASRACRSAWRSCRASSPPRRRPRSRRAWPTARSTSSSAPTRCSARACSSRTWAWSSSTRSSISASPTRRS